VFLVADFVFYTARFVDNYRYFLKPNERLWINRNFCIQNRIFSVKKTKKQEFIKKKSRPSNQSATGRLF
jgi:hypothetical protein